ncbi:L-rhamnose mutarotase [Arthrobacter bambusae]|uniref:L-rhamnose mutarotase n=1 Tax=Arthrobacter bambusae TaxID=1338426 RepID=UPI002787C9A1|nr:L-rhamnose mutarotase [Arthrobacter bambusae]MDQ0030063.1 L-rhamnose mutarotase [Arthrobacter bambusae]MDQ0097418.1 L-rhamnose mutarotase [Arthrobacter bambusae]
MAETIALHTRLKQGAEQEYADAHASIPAELVAALNDAGVANWRIWRSGQELFHLVEVEDYQAMRRALADHPANVPWQARMAELLEVQDDYSGNDSGIPLVWELA